MLFDKNLTLSDDQSLAQIAGSYLSDNSIDMGVKQTPPTRVATASGIGGPLIHDWGRIIRPDLELVSIITTTFTSAGAPTLVVQTVQADDGALTTNLEVLTETRAYALAALVQGSQFPLRMPAGLSRRFFGMRYVIAVATTTAGKVTSGFAAGRQSNVNVLTL
jgi:hypothetical protein